MEEDQPPAARRTFLRPELPPPPPVSFHQLHHSHHEQQQQPPPPPNNRAQNCHQNKDDRDEEDYQDDVEDEMEHFHGPSSQIRSAHLPKSDPDCQTFAFKLAHKGSSAAPSSSRNDAALVPFKSSEQEKQHRDDWTEVATLILLEIWGNKFLALGRRSLRQKDWTDVAEQVARLGKAVKTDVQCRNRIDTLKKKYKHEKQKLESGGNCSKWPYYENMDALLDTVPRLIGLPCAVDAGQIIRMDPHVWKNGKQQLDAATTPNFASTSSEHSDDSCEMSESSPDASENQQEGWAKKRKSTDAPFRTLAKAIKRFGEIYEKVENAKQQQLLELEKTRMEFTRDLELQKMQLLMHTQMELAKVKHGTNDMDASVGNMSG